jgi:hypothetical protein
MPKTLVELNTKAFRLLTGMGIEQSPAAEDLQSIGEYVEPLMAQLEADSVISYIDTDEIPDELFLPLARLLANVAGPEYGTAMNEDARRRDEQMLRRLLSSKPTYETQKAVYY